MWFNNSDLDSLDDEEEMNKVNKEREVSWTRKLQGVVAEVVKQLAGLKKKKKKGKKTKKKGDRRHKK